MIPLIRRIYYQSDSQNLYSDNHTKMLLGLAISCTIITVVLILTVIFLRKRIKLVIVLFKEAGKAAASMPLILFKPILVSLIVKTQYFLFSKFHNHVQLNDVYIFHIDFHSDFNDDCTLVILLNVD